MGSQQPTCFLCAREGTACLLIFALSAVLGCHTNPNPYANPYGTVPTYGAAPGYGAAPAYGTTPGYPTAPSYPYGAQQPAPWGTAPSMTRVPPPPTGSYAVPGVYSPQAPAASAAPGAVMPSTSVPSMPGGTGPVLPSTSSIPSSSGVQQASAQASLRSSTAPPSSGSNALASNPSVVDAAWHASPSGQQGGVIPAGGYSPSTATSNASPVGTGVTSSSSLPSSMPPPSWSSL
jgi:surface antigen